MFDVYTLLYLVTYICAGSLLLHTGFLYLQCTGLLIAVASFVAEHGLQAQGFNSWSTQA